MKASLIFGVSVTIISLLFSILVGVWQIAFIICATAAGIGMVISGFIKNYSLIFRAALKITSKNSSRSIKLSEEDEYWVKSFVIFAFPNFIAAVILYFIVYK